MADTEHDYLSTACLHGRCAECRHQCKFCAAACRHSCHTPSPSFLGLPIAYADVESGPLIIVPSTGVRLWKAWCWGCGAVKPDGWRIATECRYCGWFTATIEPEWAGRGGAQRRKR